MHFTYSEAQLSTDLRQGDILQRTPEIEDVLKQAHPHYLAKSDNKYFIVLTQDCDLVRRAGKPCPARYIEVAAVRPVDCVIARQLEELRERSIAIELPICTTQSRGRLRSFMERLLNNNVPDYFYLHREPSRGFPEDCCALLALSIAIKAEFHYDICLKAKILELTDSFRAKLGWLVGRMYSPIGTQDWPPETIQQEISDKIEKLSLWLEQRQLRELSKLIRDWRQNNPGQILSIEVIKELVSKVPRRQQQVINRTIDLLKEDNILPAEIEVRIANRLSNDPLLSTLLKG